MTIFGKNKYNVNFLSLPQQVSKNKIDIENLQKIIKQAYKTNQVLNDQSVSVALNTTNITDTTIKSGWLMDPNGLLFQIASVLEDLVYINFWANLKGIQGNIGPANTLTIGNVETLETGEQATAQITGQAPNQTLNLGLPKGNTGAQGPQGKAGTKIYTTNNTFSAGGEISTSDIPVTSHSEFNIGDIIISNTSGDYGTITVIQPAFSVTCSVKGNLKGPQGDQGTQGIQGKRGFGFYTTQQQLLSTGTTQIEYGDIIGYDNPQVGDFVISENAQSNGYYGIIRSLATLTTTIEYVGTLKGEKGINFVGGWISGGEYYVDDVVTYNGSSYICIENINGGTSNPASDLTHWGLFAQGGTNGLYMHHISLTLKNVTVGNTTLTNGKVVFDFINNSNEIINSTNFNDKIGSQILIGAIGIATDSTAGVVFIGEISKFSSQLTFKIFGKLGSSASVLDINKNSNISALSDTYDEDGKIYIKDTVKLI